jgi:hypothetical protein
MCAINSGMFWCKSYIVKKLGTVIGVKKNEILHIRKKHGIIKNGLHKKIIMNRSQGNGHDNELFSDNGEELYHHGQPLEIPATNDIYANQMQGLESQVVRVRQIQNNGMVVNY